MEWTVKHGALIETCHAMQGKQVSVDELLPDVLLFPAATDLHDHPLVTGSCLILQVRRCSHHLLSLCRCPDTRKCTCCCVQCAEEHNPMGMLRFSCAGHRARRRACRHMHWPLNLAGMCWTPAQLRATRPPILQVQACMMHFSPAFSLSCTRKPCCRQRNFHIRSKIPG